MLFWKRLKQAAFGASQEPPNLVGGELGAACSMASPAGPTPTTTKHHNDAVADDDHTPFDDGTDLTTSSKASVVGGHLPVYSATSPRRSQRGLKRRAPPEDEIWYNY